MSRKSFFALVFFLLCSALYAMPSELTVLDMHVSAKVGRNALVEVAEDYDIFFPSHRYHGFYRYLPLKGFDGRKLHISNFESSEHIHSIEDSGAQRIFIIGNPDSFVDGVVRYRISYTVDIGEYKEGGKEIYLYNLLGDGFDMPVDNFSFDIEFEEPIDGINVYYGKYGSMDEMDCVISSDGMHASGAVSGLGKHNAVTCRCLLPDGYYRNARHESFAVQKASRWISVSISVLFLAGMIVMLVAFGIEDKIINVVQFSSPDGMNPLEIGYVYDGFIDDRDLCAEIYYFADRGFADINGDENGSMKMRRLKEADDSLKSEERLIFNSLFEKSDEVALEKDLGESFAKSAESAKSVVSSRYRGSRFKNTSKSVKAYAAGFVFAVMHIVFFAFFMIVNGVAFDNVMVFSILQLFASVIMSVMVYKFGSDVERKISSTVLMVFGIVIFVLISAVCIFVVSSMFSYQLANVVPLLVYLLAQPAALVINSFMKKRNSAYNRLLGNIYGFRDYIKTAEIDRINTLSVDVESMKNYLSLLPFAIVFKLEKVWAEKSGKAGKYLKDSGVFIAPACWWGTPAFNDGVMEKSVRSVSRSISREINKYNVAKAAQAVKDGAHGGVSGGGGFSGGGFSGGGGGGW